MKSIGKEQLKESARRVAEFINRPTIILLALLTFFSALFLFIILFKIQISYFYINLMLQNLDGFSTRILGTVIQVLATILAIVFALSQFIMTNIADRYSIRLLDDEKSREKNIYKIYISIIAIAFFLFALDNFLPLFSAIWSVLIVFLFFISLMYLIEYFGYISKIINPKEFLEIISDRVINARETSTEEDQLKENFSVMGDISVKLIIRDEERVCLIYIAKFYELFSKFMKVKKEPNEHSSSNSDGMINEEKTEKNNILNYILENYLRIFRESVIRKKDIISQEISRNLFKILNKVMHGKNNDYFVQQLIETKQIIGTGYYQFLKLAIEEEDDSRFKLIKFITDLLKINAVSKQKIKEEYLINLLEDTLFRINKLLMNMDDFDLFKDEIDYFSMSPLIKSPIEVLNEVINNLRELNFDESSNSITRINYIKFRLEYHLIRNFKLWNEIFDEIREVITTNQEHSENEDSLTRIFEEKLYEIFSSSILYRTFFIIGAYILFLDKEGKIIGDKYIKELWTHTTPEDTDFDYVGNQTPIEFDPFWLINLYLFGGTGSELWEDEYLYAFDQFHGVRYYAVQYLILSLTNAVNNGKTIDVPSLEQLNRFRSEDELYKIDEWYDLANRFTTKYHLKELKKHLNLLVRESDKWDDLLSYEEKVVNGKEITISPEEDIPVSHGQVEPKIVNAKEALLKTEVWIDNLTEKFEDLKVEIEKLQPLDPDKKSEAETKILNSYNEKSTIPDIFNARTFESDEHRHLEFIKIAWRPLISKDCFIKTSFVDCHLIWSDIGKIIANGEINYFIRILSEDEHIEKIELEEFDPESVYKNLKSITENLIENDYQPDLLFIPIQIFVKIRSKIPDINSPLSGKLIKDGSSWFLKIDDEIKLRIIYSTKSTNFKDIIISDSNSISWIYKPSGDRRLWIDIEEYEEDSSEVDVCVRTKVSLDINNPNGIKIIVKQLEPSAHTIDIP